MSLISNLVYALRKRMGWYLEPPTVKTNDVGRFALSEGILYVERPPISFHILVIWVLLPLGLLFLIWTLPGGIGGRIAATFLLGVILLIAEGTLVVPFVRHRELSLNNNELRLRLGPFKDDVSIFDIISVEPVDEARPENLFGEAWGPGGYGFRWLALPLGVVTTQDAKWYVFGGGRTYFKIKRKSGNPVCVGVTNPNEFLEKMRMLQTRIIASQIQKLQKSYSYITTQKDGEPRIKPYVWEAEYNLYKKLFKVDEGYAKVLVDEQKPHIHLVTTFPEENERAKLRKIWIELFQEHYPEKLADFEPKNEHNSLNR